MNDVLSEPEKNAAGVVYDAPESDKDDKIQGLQADLDELVRVCKTKPEAAIKDFVAMNYPDKRPNIIRVKGSFTFRGKVAESEADYDVDKECFVDASSLEGESKTKTQYDAIKEATEAGTEFIKTAADAIIEQSRMIRTLADIVSKQNDKIEALHLYNNRSFWQKLFNLKSEQEGFVELAKWIMEARKK